MKSKCCSAETRIGYYNGTKRPDIHGDNYQGVEMGAYCTKCNELCDYVDDNGVEYYTNGIKKLNLKQPHYKFDLLPNEKKALDEFLAGLPEKYQYKKVKLIFSNGAGIGVGITAKVGKKKMDITDYGSW